MDFEEIDLSEEPNRGEEMVKLSGGVKTLPQLHVDTRVRVFVWEAVLGSGHTLLR